MVALVPSVSRGVEKVPTLTGRNARNGMSGELEMKRAQKDSHVGVEYNRTGIFMVEIQQGSRCVKCEIGQASVYCTSKGGCKAGVFARKAEASTSQEILKDAAWRLAFS